MEDGADTVGQQFIFDPNCSVLVALRKVKRLIPVPERVGLFIQRKENEFLRMKESLALREYGLNDGVRGFIPSSPSLAQRLFRISCAFDSFNTTTA